MKKLLIVGAVLAIGCLSLMPMVATAEGCCDYEVGSPCWERCCAEQTYWFKVSYFERVSTGYFFHGIEMTRGEWTSKFVEAHDRDEAAEMLGFEAGHGCVISRAIGYGG